MLRILPLSPLMIMPPFLDLWTKFQFKVDFGNFLAVQWLGLCAVTAKETRVKFLAGI